MADYTERQGSQTARNARELFATFLMLNDNYLPGCLTLAHSLRAQGVTAPLVCLTTDGVSEAAIRALDVLFDEVVPVDRIYVPHVRRQERQDRPYYFTRIQVLRLGADGSMGFRCESVVVIDADVLALSRFQSLFEIPAPAGVLNERKENFVETGPDGEFVVSPATRQTGEWRWHEIYRTCPHADPVPKEITDRVASDPTNMGINGSLFVMQPNREEFEAILADVQRPEVAGLVGDKFDWPDMQYLTMRWSGRWRSIDARFSALNGYPDLDLIWGSHFAGFKPWYFQRETAMRRYIRFPDFQMWFKSYAQMVDRYPQLLDMGKLRRLRESIGAALGESDASHDGRQAGDGGGRKKSGPAGARTKKGPSQRGKGLSK